MSEVTHKLTLVRSGGQTGADVAGVLAAKACGLQTGGVMPRGWITLDGPKPQYAEMFGMVEHPSPQYPPRTECNVRDSDGTIRLAYDFDSRGERLTKRLVDRYGRPDFEVDLNVVPPYQQIVDWIRDREISTLNVAGNSHRTNPAVGLVAFDLLMLVFSYLTGEVDAKFVHAVRKRFQTGIYQH